MFLEDGKSDFISETRAKLKSKHCESEVSDLENLITIDTPPYVMYSKIHKYLKNGEKKGLWDYQEACLSSVHRNWILNLWHYFKHKIIP